MQIKNIEFKAQVDNLAYLEEKLKQHQPRLVGTDHQTDTYFNAKQGRLKLREGNIENALIQYHREDTAEAKTSDIILYKHTPDKALKEILTLQLGIKVVVEKKRKIYFIENIKFHFDEVLHLGTFIEVEAISENNTIPTTVLQEQCDRYFHFFEIKPSQLIKTSYSDMLIAKNSRFQIVQEGKKLRVKTQDAEYLLNNLSPTDFDQYYNQYYQQLSLDFAPLLFQGKKIQLSPKEQQRLTDHFILSCLYFYSLHEFPLSPRKEDYESATMLDEIIAITEEKYGKNSPQSIALGAKILRKEPQQYLQAVEGRKRHYDK